MIRLNLIEAAEKLTVVETVSPVNITRVEDLNKGGSKKFRNILVAAVLVVIGFTCYLSVCGVPGPLQGVLPAEYLDLIGAQDPVLENARKAQKAKEADAEANNQALIKRQRETMTVKQVVGEINPNVLYNNKRSDYNSFLPLEKASYQKASVGQFFAFLTTATPDDVGFSDCIYQLPNYFYVRGATRNPNSQRSFLERIKTVSTDFQSPSLEAGAPATDVTAFGQYNVGNVNLKSVDSYVPAADVAAETKALKALASANKVRLSGMEKPQVEDFGVYKRYAYASTTQADFSDLQAFIAAYAASPLRFGVKSIEMKQAKSSLTTTVRFEMYVAP
ncbi:MAG: hypothetical protein MJY93_06560 [Fibrobacter sp.]|nr:hypothetical protein [Fibrobacter sp.]